MVTVKFPLAVGDMIKLKDTGKEYSVKSLIFESRKLYVLYKDTERNDVVKTSLINVVKNSKRFTFIKLSLGELKSGRDIDRDIECRGKVVGAEVTDSGLLLYLDTGDNMSRIRVRDKYCQP